MKNIILFITFLICLVLTSFIKNNTRTIEKKLFTLNTEIKNLIYKLDEANFELEYLTTPENLIILSSKYLDDNFNQYNIANIYYFDLSYSKSRDNSLKENHKEKGNLDIKLSNFLSFFNFLKKKNN